MKTSLLAGATALACLALGGCASLTGAGGQDAATAASNASSVLNSFNAALAQNCTGTAHLTIAPPLPPQGSLDINCAVGKGIAAAAPPASEPSK
jgi:hypothetical protein